VAVIVKSVRIASVKIAKGRRPARDVRELAGSIQELGLLNPITVTKGNNLVAGLHRIRACELLGWKTITAIEIEADALHAQLAEIDENLVRNELTVLERSEQLARRKQVYEAIHPETRKGGDQKSAAAMGRWMCNVVRAA